MSKKNHKKLVITDKHIEAIAGKTVKFVFPIFGMLTAHIDGKITGRLRNRFKTFVFVPTFPFMSFTFATSDVESIDITNFGIIVALNEVIEKKKRKRKKKKAAPIVAPEPDVKIDLNQQKSIESTVEPATV